MTKKKIATLTVTGAAVLAALILGAASFVTIPAGHTGVVVNLGKVSGTVLTEGPHFVAPFVTQVVKMDNRVLKAEVA